MKRKRPGGVYEFPPGPAMTTQAKSILTAAMGCCQMAMPREAKMKMSRASATTTQMIQRKGSGIDGGPANFVTSQTTKETTTAITSSVMSQPRSALCPAGL